MGKKFATVSLAVAVVAAASVPALAQLQKRPPPAIAASAPMDSARRLLDAAAKPSPLARQEVLSRFARSLNVPPPPAENVEAAFRFTPRGGTGNSSARPAFFAAGVFPFSFAGANGRPIPDGIVTLSTDESSVLLMFDVVPSRRYLVDCVIDDGNVKVAHGPATGATSFTAPAMGGHLVFGIPSQTSAGPYTISLRREGSAARVWLSCDVAPVR